MNRRPPQPPQSLDAGERALARALPRLHGRSEPGPDLDASILAAARAALQPARATRNPAGLQGRWIAPLSLAASLLLAIGLVWRLRPLPAPIPDIAKPAAQADNSSTDERPGMGMIEPPVAPQQVPMEVSPAYEQIRPGMTPTTPPGRQQTTVPAPAASARESVQMQQPMPSRASAAAAAAPPPAPPSAAASSITATDSQASERAANAGMAKPASPTIESAPRDGWPATAGKPGMAESARQSRPEPARPVPVAPGVVDEAEMAAEAGFVEDPDDSVPPATVDSPAVRDAWLQRIRQLLDQGNMKDARASLAEFRRRYPDAALPAALQVLESKP